MARQNLGSAPSRPIDYVDVGWVTSTYPSYSHRLSSGTNRTLGTPTLATGNFNPQMDIYEINATADITVSFSDDVLLTNGVVSTYRIPSGKTGFFGFRYSPHVGEWFLLSATVQV